MVATQYDYLLTVLGHLSDDFIANAHCVTTYAVQSSFVIFRLPTSHFF